MMMPSVYSTYSFKFISPFDALDEIYTVNQILTFDELLLLNIDLVTNLYSKVNLTEEEYNADVNNYKTEKIIKLLKPDDLEENAIYIPIPLLRSMPDPYVKAYYKLSLGINLGVYNEPDQISHLKDTINEHIGATVGFEPNNELIIIDLGKKWMSESDYEASVIKRDTSAKRVLNYFSENVKLRKEIDELKTKLKYYEETLILLKS